MIIVIIIIMITFSLGPASALNSRMSSGFWTKERATQSIDRVKANSKSLEKRRNEIDEENSIKCVRMIKEDCRRRGEKKKIISNRLIWEKE